MGNILTRPLKHITKQLKVKKSKGQDKPDGCKRVSVVGAGTRGWSDKPSPLDSSADEEDEYSDEDVLGSLQGDGVQFRHFKHFTLHILPDFNPAGECTIRELSDTDSSDTDEPEVELVFDGPYRPTFSPVLSVIGEAAEEYESRIRSSRLVSRTRTSPLASREDKSECEISPTQNDKKRFVWSVCQIINYHLFKMMKMTPKDEGQLLFAGTWPKVQDADLYVNPKTFKKHKTIVKDLCRQWGGANKVLLALTWNMKHPETKRSIPTAVAHYLTSPPKEKSAICRLLSCVGKVLSKPFRRRTDHLKCWQNAENMTSQRGAKSQTWTEASDATDIPTGVILVRSATPENTLELHDGGDSLQKEKSMMSKRVDSDWKDLPSGVILVRSATPENTLDLDGDDADR